MSSLTHVNTMWWLEVPTIPSCLQRMLESEICQQKVQRFSPLMCREEYMWFAKPCTIKRLLKGSYSRWKFRSPRIMMWECLCSCSRVSSSSIWKSSAVCPCLRGQYMTQEESSAVT
ncbi:hypothetical protein E2C01_077624 [Portunus trituberculatus]|uniref:Uncharacterized protein n=1 Tax=Portunus trituberculatus TaxID=210409 RepID=A0A5B7IKS1_PORTR|nr:hypothetical protein [Portunus trituberculatus]